MTRQDTVFVFYLGRKQIFDIVKEGSSAPKFLHTDLRFILGKCFTSLEDDLVRFTSKIGIDLNFFLASADRRHKS